MGGLRGLTEDVTLRKDPKELRERAGDTYGGEHSRQGTQREPRPCSGTVPAVSGKRGK